MCVILSWPNASRALYPRFGSKKIRSRWASICATVPRVRLPSDVRVASRCLSAFPFVREHTYATFALSDVNQSSLMLSLSEMAPFQDSYVGSAASSS